ncbi:unnamed protein product [Musa textilis]
MLSFFFQCFPSFSLHWIREGGRFDLCCSEEEDCHIKETMKIAVEGCLHGEMDKVYDTIRHIEKVENIKIDLLICCGDFQVLQLLTCFISVARIFEFGTKSYHYLLTYQHVMNLFLEIDKSIIYPILELWQPTWSCANTNAFDGFDAVSSKGGDEVGEGDGIRFRLGRPPQTKTESHRVERGRNHDMKKTEFIKIHKSTYLWIILEGEEIIGRVQNSVKLIGMEYRTSFPHAREGAIRGDGATFPTMAIKYNTLSCPFWHSSETHLKLGGVTILLSSTWIVKILTLLESEKWLRLTTLKPLPGTKKIKYQSTQPTNSSQMQVYTCPLSEKPLRSYMYQYFVFLLFMVHESGVWSQFNIQPVPHTAGHCRNPQTESLLQLLELPYLLDNVAEAGMPSQNTNFFNSKGI